MIGMIAIVRAKCFEMTLISRLGHYRRERVRSFYHVIVAAIAMALFLSGLCALSMTCFCCTSDNLRWNEDERGFDRGVRADTFRNMLRTRVCGSTLDSFSGCRRNVSRDHCSFVGDSFGCYCGDSLWLTVPIIGNEILCMLECTGCDNRARDPSVCVRDWIAEVRSKKV